ncbi:MAG: hypothetical protein K8I29_12810 [Alphaproteobacteria bacterium]|uniref:Cytochrome c n=1 Tax=Candidatus Nitrobium versatile TaxID=2884831 RepID=A0A953J637_9BACT|nr:hypothetical protein [Candidatus Nitrobium versatile]
MIKILSSLLFLIALAIAGADRAGAHSAKHEVSPGMKKQHHSMMIIDRQWKALKRALGRGDRNGADTAAGEILKASAGMEDFILHKNAGHHSRFVTYCKEFIESMTKLRETLPEADLNKADTLLNPVRSKCVQCHEIFK